MPFVICRGRNLVSLASKWTESDNNWEGFAWDVIFQNITVCNFCLKKIVFIFSVKREMPILFFVNCDRTVLFSVKCDLDPPFTTLPNMCTQNLTLYILFLVLLSLRHTTYSSFFHPLLSQTKKYFGHWVPK